MFSLNRKTKSFWNKSKWNEKLKLGSREKSQVFLHISSFFSAVVFVFRNEEKLVALLVYSSGKEVATNELRRVPVVTASRTQVTQAVLNWGENTPPHRFQQNFVAQHCDWNSCDLTRPVTTEKVRNKSSLLESFMPLYRHLLVLVTLRFTLQRTF